MIDDLELLEDNAEDLFEHAPCGYLSTRMDGTIVRVNRTFEAWTGLRREQLLGEKRFHDLLAPGGRIYYETHLAPLLLMQGAAREIAVEIVHADGSRLPALINCVVRTDDAGRPQVIRITVFEAADRRRYEQELLRARQRDHAIAEELQRSLLSGTLPAATGLELDVAYRPAVTGLQVGGDWYDAFWLDDGRIVALVVGDVVGRGIGAAATMGQLRSAVRALAATGLAPGALLGALDQYSRRHGVGQMTTLVYAQLDLESGLLRYACAGHPPPVIVAPGEKPRVAWDGRFLPLDVYGGPASTPEEGRCRLARGGMVLLYTDGLIERRSQSLDDGIERLLDEVAARRDDPIATLPRALLGLLRDQAHPDDVCVLAARLSAGSAP